MTDYVPCPACRGKGVIEIDEADHPGLTEIRRAAETGDRKAKKMLVLLREQIALKAVKEVRSR